MAIGMGTWLLAPLHSQHFQALKEFMSRFMCMDDSYTKSQISSVCLSNWNDSFCIRQKIVTGRHLEECIKDLYYLLHFVDFVGNTLKLENKIYKFIKFMNFFKNSREIVFPKFLAKFQI